MAEWDWTSVYKETELLDNDEESEQTNTEPNPPVSAACSHDHSAERAIYDLSLEDKIRKMNEHQAKGNSFFEEGQYDRALIQYKQAMVVYEYTFPEEDETWKVIDKIRFNCNLNVAASANELGLWSETIQNCYEALRVDPDNVKALYRRAQAHRRTDHFEEAKSDLKAALKLRPHDFQLREELALLKSQIKAYKENSKAMAEKMISHKEKQKLADETVSISTAKPRKQRVSLLEISKNSSYVGADDINDPVMYDMSAVDSFIGGLETSHNLDQYMRPYAEGSGPVSRKEVKPSETKEAQSSRESWVFGDLNRPGAFVRQRPRNNPTGEKRNCLCCT